jgi:hypothetical protein
MARWLVLVMALVACKKDLGPVHDGISRVDVSVKSALGDGYYLHISFTARTVKRSRHVLDARILAACQLGPDRILAAESMMTALTEGETREASEDVFLLKPLPEEPTLCDLDFFDGDTSLARMCWNDGTITEGPCAPNAISNVGVGPTGLTTEITKVTPENADDMGFPAHLTVEYRATAHRDMPKGAYLVRRTSCPGLGADDTWHSELQYLRAGETILAAQNTYRLGRPPAGTPCETTLGFSPNVDGEVTKIATFCHRDTTITPGACK